MSELVANIMLDWHGGLLPEPTESSKWIGIQFAMQKDYFEITSALEFHRIRDNYDGNPMIATFDVIQVDSPDNEKLRDMPVLSVHPKDYVPPLVFIRY